MASQVPVLYQDRDTVLHRRDVRVKILLFALLFIYLFVAPNWQWLLVPTILGLILAVVAHTPWKWLAVLWLLHLPSFIVLLGVPIGKQLVVEGFQMNKDIASGLRLTLAWTAAIFVSVSLFSTVDTDDLTDGLRGLGVPAVAALAVGLSYRLLYVTLSQIFQIADAMKIKGVDLETRNPVRLIGNSLKLSMPILFTVVRRGPILMSALEMRGVLKGQRGSRLSELDSADVVLLGCAFVICGLALGARLGLLPSLFSMVGLG
jgi:energy-coupling factor transport system permease protein